MGAGTYALVETTVRQQLALKYATARGKIIESQVGHGVFLRRGVEILYNFAVNGAELIQPVAPVNPDNGKLPTILGGSCASIEVDPITAPPSTTTMAATIDSLVFFQQVIATI